MLKCCTCLLPAAVPGSDIDASGRCAPCRSYVRADPKNGQRARWREDLERTLLTIRGSGRYDCLVPLSGGKDSLYLLHRLKEEYGLRVLAFTAAIDLPAAAWSSIRLAVDKLGVDHVVWRPSGRFLGKLFRHLLCNQEERGAVYTVSYVYAPLFEGEAIRMAIRERIPVVLAGYSPGQPEPARMEYEFSSALVSAEDWTPPRLRACGAFTPDELANFYNPQELPAETAFPRYLAPFHAWDYNQKEVIQRVTELGLVRRRSHANPIVSNYPINWLMMYSDLKHFGFNPYAPEFSALIRDGRASRAYWRMMAPVVDAMIRHRVLLGRNVVHSMRWLGLTSKDLCINQPRGAYDPPIISGRAA
ncbi:MAG: hypothetical protein HY859_01970 [Caulobacterales bacterium]|nr:hypothetical protein [Caulobacterales bacterium]